MTGGFVEKERIFSLVSEQKMDGFGDDFTAVGEVDPAAEFLAREQDQLAGLEDELLNGVQSHEIAQPAQGKLSGPKNHLDVVMHDTNLIIL